MSADGYHSQRILPAFRDGLTARTEWRGLFFQGLEMTRVAVFLDYQNVYNGALDAFDLRGQGHMVGQVYPRRLGVLLTDRGRPGPKGDPTRDLESVNVYSGEPSPKHSAIGQAARQRQVRYWNSQGCVRAVTRPLKYYPKGRDALGREVFEAREKGIDVHLAVDMVAGALRNDYDVAILFSADTDLLPALEAVRAAGKRCEVAAWRSPVGYSSRLQLPRLWCHWLDRKDYDFVWDPTDYTREVAVPPSVDP